MASFSWTSQRHVGTAQGVRNLGKERLIILRWRNLSRGWFLSQILDCCTRQTLKGGRRQGQHGYRHAARLVCRLPPCRRRWPSWVLHEVVPPICDLVLILYHLKYYAPIFQQGGTPSQIIRRKVATSRRTSCTTHMNKLQLSQLPVSLSHVFVTF